MRISEEFKNDPDAVPLIARIIEAREVLERIKEKTRQPNDASKLAVGRDLRA